MYVYRCEDTLESILTAIYRVYEEHRPKNEVLLALDGESRLFATQIYVEADNVRSEKVARTLCERFGREEYERICLALTAPEPGKAQAVYRTIVHGLEGRGHIFENLGDAEVCKAFKLARSAERECCHLEGFLRFEELESGVLYAQVKPKNHLLSFLMAHFSDRFPEEDFLIHDVGRNLVGMHCKKAAWGRQEQRKESNLADWAVARGPEEMLPRGLDAMEADGAERVRTGLKLSAEELRYRELFTQFCRTIGIRERENPELQKNMLPLHFRKYMTEFREEA